MNILALLFTAGPRALITGCLCSPQIFSPQILPVLLVFISKKPLLRREEQKVNYSLSSLQCSVSCGIGSKRRNVTCQNIDTEEVLQPESCSLAFKPKDEEKCNPGPCTVTWMASDWSEVGHLGNKERLMSRMRLRKV